jgi:hypothetical protein
MIKSCTCKHEFQDSLYGKGMRQHTLSLKEKTPRCTVCGGKARWVERVRLHWQAPGVVLAPFLMPPMNTKLCTENRMKK